MATTLKDIAAACGVSIGTVERALKGKGRINPEVAARVCAVAKEMNYRPNIVAKGLVNRSRKYKICLLYTSWPDADGRSIYGSFRQYHCDPGPWVSEYSCGRAAYSDFCV